MPFQSEKQRRFLWAAHPDIAKHWAQEYPESNKNLPLYAHAHGASNDDSAKTAAIAALRFAATKWANITNLVNINTLGAGETKAANSGMVRVPMPNSEKPTYAGQQREQGTAQPTGNTDCAPSDIRNSRNPKEQDENAVAALFGKLSAVLAQPLREALEAEQAMQEGREPRFVPSTLGLRQFSAPSPTIAPPMGMAAAPGQPQPQAQAQVQQPGNTPSNGPVGGGSNPQFNPINAFGAIGAKGQLNGNAAFGQKNSPGSSKVAGLFYKDLPSPRSMMVHDDHGSGLGVLRTQDPRLLTRLFSNPSSDIAKALRTLPPNVGDNADTDPAQHISNALGQQLIEKFPSRYRAPDLESHLRTFVGEMEKHPEPTTPEDLAALQKQYAPMKTPYYLDAEDRGHFGNTMNTVLDPKWLSKKLKQKTASLGGAVARNIGRAAEEEGADPATAITLGLLGAGGAYGAYYGGKKVLTPIVRRMNVRTLPEDEVGQFALQMKGTDALHPFAERYREPGMFGSLFMNDDAENVSQALLAASAKRPGFAKRLKSRDWTPEDLDYTGQTLVNQHPHRYRPVSSKAAAFGEKISMPRGLGELPQGAGPDQIADAIMRFNQLRTLVRPTDETLRGHNLSRKGFQGSLRKITAHSQGKDRFDLQSVAPNPKLRAALAGLAGLGAAGGLAYTGNTEAALGALPATALAAGGAYLHGQQERGDVLNTAKLMKQYGLLKPKLLQQAYPLLGDGYRVA